MSVTALHPKSYTTGTVDDFISIQKVASMSVTAKSFSFAFWARRRTVATRQMVLWHERCVAACCSVLQRVAVWCGVLQSVEEWCIGCLFAFWARHCTVAAKRMWHEGCVAMCCSVLQYVAVCCSVLQWCVTLCGSVLQCCIVLQRVAECCIDCLIICGACRHKIAARRKVSRLV